MSEAYGYKIPIGTDRLRYNSDGQQYGSWSAESYHRLSDTITADSEYPDITAPFKFEEGEIGYVVWVIWSHGDSFGHHTRGSSEVVGLFKDAESAMELRNCLLDTGNYFKKNPEYAYNIRTKDGQTFSAGYASWSGYFESVDEVRVDTVIFTV